MPRRARPPDKSLRLAMAEAVTDGWRVNGFVIPVPSVILLVLAAQAVSVTYTSRARAWESGIKAMSKLISSSSLTSRGASGRGRTSTPNFAIINLLRTVDTPPRRYRRESFAGRSPVVQQWPLSPPRRAQGWRRNEESPKPRESGPPPHDAFNLFFLI